MGTLVCITGGAGYIGRSFISYLLSRGVSPRDITAVDNASSRTSRLPLPVGVRFCHGDICDRSMMAAWLSDHRPAVVVNLAGLADVLDSEQRVNEYLHTNVLGVQAVAEAMCSALPAFRLIQASSCAVYGAYTRSIMQPKSWYGKTKLFAEDYLARLPSSRSYHALQPDPAGILALRLFNVYGVYVPPCTKVTQDVVVKLGTGDPDIASTRLMQRLAVSAVAGAPSCLIRNDFVRDYVHIEDVCRALGLAVSVLAKGKQREPFEAIDIGTGRGRSTSWLAEHWGRYAGATPAYETQYAGINEEIASPEASVAVASVDAAKAVLNWKARVPISQGIHTLQMYMNHVVRNGGKK